MENKSKTTCPTFEEVTLALSNTLFENVLPSKLHGAICAIICFYPGITATHCLQLIFQEETEQADNKLCLYHCTNLFQYSWETLQEMDFGFTLLLPDEENAPLNSRVEALAQWCEGFSQTAGLCIKAEGIQLSAEIAESIESITEIATVYADEDDNDESTKESNLQETALSDLAEYVRLATLMIFAEMLESRKSFTDSQVDSESVH